MFPNSLNEGNYILGNISRSCVVLEIFKIIYFTLIMCEFL